jgi:hypothetical protein
MQEIHSLDPYATGLLIREFGGCPDMDEPDLLEKTDTTGDAVYT